MTYLDTAFNYRHFTSHKTLATTAGDLLPKFTLSTKVGYFPGGQHSLDPVRLRQALEETNRNLGSVPDLVFLHNPEHTLRDAPNARDMLAGACATLEDATTAGLCGSWGIASWKPGPLVGLVDDTAPKPSVLMVRAGLMVGITTLEAADELATRWGLDGEAVWGMSPFGGSLNEPVWDRVDARLFLKENPEGLSRVQAAFRVAYGLPRVRRVAVSTDSPVHLRELVNGLDAEVDAQAIQQYRDLLHDRKRRQAA